MNGMAICAGVGGIELGLRLAEPGYRTICYIEREAYTVAILRTQMEAKLMDEAPIWDDVKTFMGLAWRGKVDIITAGFPCQPWSHAGKGKGTEDERWIWPDIARIIDEVRPRYVFLENVPGLVSRGGLLEVLGDLAKIGYDAEWTHLSAADVGANHKRERVWILAHAPGARNGTPEDRKSSEEGTQRTAGGCGCVDGAVADTYAGRELQQEGIEQDKRRRAGNGGQDVENPIGQRRRGRYNGENGGEDRTLQVEGSGTLAHPLSHGLGGVLRETRQRQDGAQQREDINRESPGNGRSRAPCAEISNANSERLEKQCGPLTTDQGSGRQELKRSGWWAVEPLVGRVVNGLPYRVDRLRACGNGVVPLVAATAYRELKRRASTH